jgi:hypothetical protein
VAARRIRTDPRWDVGVGAGGRKPGSKCRLWRSLDVDNYAEVEPAERWKHENNSEEDYRDGRSGNVRRRGVLKDQPPPENPVRKV